MPLHSALIQTLAGMSVVLTWTDQWILTRSVTLLIKAPSQTSHHTRSNRGHQRQRGGEGAGDGGEGAGAGIGASVGSRDEEDEDENGPSASWMPDGTSPGCPSLPDSDGTATLCVEQ